MDAMDKLLKGLRDMERQMVEAAGKGLGQLSTQDYAVLSGQRQLLVQIIAAAEQLDNEEASSAA